MFVLWHTLLFFLLKKLLYTELDRCRFEEVGHWVSDIGLLDSGHPKPGVLGLKNQDAFKKCIVFEEKKLRVVINVLTNLKRFHRPVSSSLSI